MAAFENLSALLEALPSEDNKLERLQEINAMLMPLHPSALKDVVLNITFDVIFDALNTNNSEQLAVCCDVLSKLLSAVEPNLVLNNFYNELLTGLGHPATSIKMLCVQQVRRASMTHSGELLSRVEILSEVTSLLGDDSLQLAKVTAELLITLGLQTEFLEVLFSESVLQQLRDVLSSSDVNRYRVYELLVDLVIQTPASLQYGVSSGILPMMLREMEDGVDVLVRLNCLELLTRLATCAHGLNYMHDLGVVERLGVMMNAAEDDPLTALLLPGLIKFFGSVAYLHPQKVLGRYPTFPDRVFGLLSSGDLTMQGIAVETLGFVGSTVEGKRALVKYDQQMSSAMSHLSDLLKGAPPELRVKAFSAVSSLLNAGCGGVQQETDVLAVTERWYCHLGAAPLDTLLTLAAQPFLEVRCEALGVLRVLAAQRWGQERLAAHPTFREYLLDRSTETEKEAREVKYHVVHTLAESPSTAEVLGNVYFVKLKQYQLEGPFYRHSEAAVAMESG